MEYSQSEKGFDPYLVNMLAARGITFAQHETKMANLAKFGPVVLKAITHNAYEVEGHIGLYNPYTDFWSAA